MINMLKNFLKSQHNEDRYGGYQMEFLEKKNNWEENFIGD